MKELNRFSISELVKELMEREGIEAHTAEPDKGLNIDVEGPAIVLIVTD